MAVEQTIITNMNAGEWSPLMEGRLEQDGYFASARILENMVPTTWGAIMMRGGTIHITEVQNSANAAALIPFRYSTIQAYQFEAAANYMIPLIDRAQVVVAETDAAITNGAFTSNITGWDDRSTGSGSNAIAHDSTNGRLSLVPDGTASDDIGWAEQDVTVGASYQNVEHVLQFDVVGVHGDQVEVQIGTSSTGAEVVGPLTRKVGRHTLAFTPGATTFYVQFRNLGAFREKTVQIDNVALLSDEPVKVPTPYAAADVMGLRWEQSVDVLYLNHPDYARRRLERYGHATWSLVEMDYEDGPYLKENATDTTLTPGATVATGTTGATITASSTIGINGDTGFQSTDVGRMIRLKIGSDPWGWGVITAVASTTSITVDIRLTLTTGSTATTAWRLGLYSDTTGHPKAGAFHEQRSAIGGAAGAPDRTDLSAVDDFPKFSPDANDDDAIPLVLASGGANPVYWLVSAKTLLVGTAENVADERPAVVRASGAFGIGSTSSTTPLSPSSAQAKPEEVTVLSIERFGERLRALGYEFGEDGYVALDKSIRAEHIGEYGLSRQAFQLVPWSIDWMVRGDGQAAAFTYEREQRVEAWSRHKLGGAFQGGIAVVEDMSVIPGDNGDDLYMLVKRTINGQTKRYIEVMSDRFNRVTKQRYAVFCDSSLTYDNKKTISAATQANPVVLTLESGHGIGNDDVFIVNDIVGMTELNGNTYTAKNITATTVEVYNAAGAAAVDGTGFTAYQSGGVVNEKVTTISGLDHLEGQTVAVLGDGARQAQQTVSSGAITLANAAGVVTVGLPYTWIFQPQRLEGGARLGTAQITPKQISDLRARLFRSGPFQVGPDADNLSTVPVGPVTLGQATPLFSGDVELPFDSQNNTDGGMYFTGTSPTPVAIVALVMRVTTQEGG